MPKDIFYEKGQSLMEVLIAIGIAATLIGSVVSTYVVSLRSNANARLSAIGTQLAQETYDNVKALAESDWHSVYLITKSADYHLALSGDNFDIVSGTETVEVDDTEYVRSFTIENAQRDIAGGIVLSGGEDSPSTQRVTVTVSWPIAGDTANTKISGYITRHRNISLRLTNWVEGPSNEGPFIGQASGFSSSTNVDYTTLPGVIKLLSF
jgi:type II secretory pathway pseudopilin PulG